MTTICLLVTIWMPLVLVMLIFQSCAVNCTCGKLWLIDEYYRKIVCALTTADALCILCKNKFLQVLV